jgi:hypothetical protein
LYPGSSLAGQGRLRSSGTPSAVASEVRII